jgi:stage II sporulation protein M
LRKTSRKDDFDSLNRSIMIVGILFIISVAIGTYLNKIIPGSGNMIDNINPTVNYYNSGISVVQTVFANYKSDLLFMGIMAICGLFVITVPLAGLVFILKGISIGYAINSCIIALKVKSTSLVVLVIIKNLIIIPGGILLLLLAINYFREIIYRYKRVSNRNIFSLVKRYVFNVLIVIIVSTGLQLVLNTVSIGIMKFLAR